MQCSYWGWEVECKSATTQQHISHSIFRPDETGSFTLILVIAIIHPLPPHTHTTAFLTFPFTHPSHITRDYIEKIQDEWAWLKYAVEKVILLSIQSRLDLTSHYKNHRQLIKQKYKMYVKRRVIETRSDEDLPFAWLECRHSPSLIRGECCFDSEPGRYHRRHRRQRHRRPPPPPVKIPPRAGCDYYCSYSYYSSPPVPPQLGSDGGSGSSPVGDVPATSWGGGGGRRREISWGGVPSCPPLRTAFVQQHTLFDDTRFRIIKINTTQSVFVKIVTNLKKLSLYLKQCFHTILAKTEHRRPCLTLIVEWIIPGDAFLPSVLLCGANSLMIWYSSHSATTMRPNCLVLNNSRVQ